MSAPVRLREKKKNKQQQKSLFGWLLFLLQPAIKPDRESLRLDAFFVIRAAQIGEPPIATVAILREALLGSNFLFHIQPLGREKFSQSVGRSVGSPVSPSCALSHPADGSDQTPSLSQLAYSHLEQLGRSITRHGPTLRERRLQGHSA